MNANPIPFQTTDWNSIPKTTHRKLPTNAKKFPEITWQIIGVRKAISFIVLKERLKVNYPPGKNI